MGYVKTRSTPASFPPVTVKWTVEAREKSQMSSISRCNLDQCGCKSYAHALRTKVRNRATNHAPHRLISLH